VINFKYQAPGLLTLTLHKLLSFSLAAMLEAVAFSGQMLDA
jgi:hypothetical protein